MSRVNLIMMLLLMISISVVGAQEISTESNLDQPEATVEPTVAQLETDDEQEIEYPIVPVQVGSAHVRAIPSLDGVEIGSVFLDDRLQVVGRNADGTWFEVRRIGRQTSLGWLFNEMVDWEFRPELLPMTDRETGVVGTPIIDSGFTVFVLQNAVMRDQPDRSGTQITTIPLLTTVPVVNRNQDASWLKVNYLGQVGWVVGFITRQPENILAAPLAEGLPPRPEVFVVPPEIQLEQVQALREYVILSRGVATDLFFFWDTVSKGNTMPCEPPAFVVAYQATDTDVQQLPELNRIVPRMFTAIDYINSSIDPLTQCGVIEVQAVFQARADAINAQVILDNSIVQLDNVESIILNQIDK